MRNDIYSVHNEVLMSHRARPVVRLASPWASRHSHCCGLTAYVALHWVGRGPPSAPSLMVTPFPSGSTHSFFPLSATLKIAFSRICIIVYSKISVPAYVSSRVCVIVYSRYIFKNISVLKDISNYSCEDFPLL